MLATRSAGWRVNTPWTTSEATVSWMARPSLSTWPSGSLLPNPNSRRPPHAEPKLAS
jgi:hypothetical protein